MSYKSPHQRYNKTSRLSDAKNKGKTGLMWAGLLSIVYFAYSYTSIFPYLLFLKEGFELSFEDFEMPMRYVVTAAQIFVASVVVMLIAKYLLGIKKKDVEV